MLKSKPNVFFLNIVSAQQLKIKLIFVLVKKLFFCEKKNVHYENYSIMKLRFFEGKQIVLVENKLLSNTQD